MSIIDQRAESLRPGAIVELFTIDLNPMGFNVKFHFQQADALGGTVWFGGKEYQPRPIKITGFKTSSEEAPPEPTMTIANVDKGGYALLTEYGELLGAKVTRIKTYAEFLDFLPDGVTPNPSADASAQFLPEIWYVEQKQNSTRIQIVFRLRSILDLRDKKIPGRVMLKETCTREYRVYDPTIGDFRYSTHNACPYADAATFTRDGAGATAATDQCGKDPGGCALRFPGQSLPGWFFPGMQRIPRNAR